MHPLKTLKFGIEVETLCRSRVAALRAVHSVVGGTLQETFGSLSLTAPDGRVWRVVRDASLSAPPGYEGAELVTPILTYADIELVQEVVRALRRAGATTNDSCGIHVHVGAERMTPQNLVNLVKIVRRQEPLLMHAMDIHPARARYCAAIDQRFYDRLLRSPIQTDRQLNVAWYGSYESSPRRYDSSRYRALNLHALWLHRTVEFRWANGTLHAGQVKAYAQIALALAAKAMAVTHTRKGQRPFEATTSRYDMRVFLLGLGLIGEEFKTCRDHMMRRCEGSASYKRGRPQAAGARSTR